MPNQPPALRRPVEIVRQEPASPRLPTAVLLLNSLARMHPATAVTLVLATAGLTVGGIVALVALAAAVVAAVAAIVGMVTFGLASLVVIVLALGGANREGGR